MVRGFQTSRFFLLLLIERDVPGTAWFENWGVRERFQMLAHSNLHFIKHLNDGNTLFQVEQEKLAT